MIPGVHRIYNQPCHRDIATCFRRYDVKLNFKLAKSLTTVPIVITITRSI